MPGIRRTWYAGIAVAVLAAAGTEGAVRAAPFLTPPPAGGPSTPATSPPTDASAPPAPYPPPPQGAAPAPTYPAPAYPAPQYPPASNPYAYPSYPSYPSYPPGPPNYPAYPPSYPYPYQPPTGWDPAVQERRRASFHGHDGFYLNLGAGIVFARNTIPDAAAKIEASGTGPMFTAALGGAVVRNVILCVRYQFNDAEAHLEDAVRGYDRESVSAESHFLGGALVYYLEDTNVFFAGALGMTWFDVRDEYDSYLIDTRARFGGALDLGKEWWMSSNWGIGAVIRASYGTAKDLALANSAWTNLGLSLLFSATYN